ncbi:predicted protein, partial [Nematostella vectensis]
VIAGSFLHDFLPIPSSYLSNKRNVFNVYFVKIGWGWTWGLLTAVTILASWVHTPGNLVSMLRHYSRLFVATLAWFLWVSLFEQIEHWTGVCKGQSSLDSKYVCHKKGFLWRGFDISGHCFLLIHCALTISEEIQVVRHLTMSGKYWYKILRPLIVTAFICTAALLVLWEAMLVLTCLYFHTVYQKILGALIAIFTWFGTYHYLYKENVIPFIPCPLKPDI